jgi:hypothetical protein
MISTPWCYIYPYDIKKTNEKGGNNMISLAHAGSVCEKSRDPFSLSLCNNFLSPLLACLGEGQASTMLLFGTELTAQQGEKHSREEDDLNNAINRLSEQESKLLLVTFAVVPSLFRVLTLPLTPPPPPPSLPPAKLGTGAHSAAAPV